jgi:hypothetical protein
MSGEETSGLSTETEFEKWRQYAAKELFSKAENP